MKVFDIALKDLKRSMRSAFLLGMMFAAPLLVTGLIYFAFGSTTGGESVIPPVRVGVVNLDEMPEGLSMDASLGESIRFMFFDVSVQSWIQAQDYPDEASVRAALNAQEIGVAVIIPRTFTEDYFAGQDGEQVLILQDPTLSIGPTVVREMVAAMLDGVAGAEVAHATIQSRLEANGMPLDAALLPSLMQRYTDWHIDFQRALFHSAERAALAAVPPETGGDESGALQAMMGLVMTGQMIFFSFFTGSYAMASILQESEEGTLARIFTTPTNRTIILAGKFLAVLLTVILQGVVMMIAGALLFGVQWGNPASAALTFLAQMGASVGLAVLLVSFIKTHKQTGPIFGGALTGLGMMSGLFTTNIKMPEGFNMLGNFTPQGWVLKAWKLTLAGSPANELLVPFVVLTAMAVVMFAIGALLFRRRFA